MAERERDLQEETRTHRGETESLNSSSSIHPSGSVASNVPDKYGFFGAANRQNHSPTRSGGVAPSSQVILLREAKWIEMLKKWDKYMNSNYQKVKKRCRKGIPQSIRSRAWLYLCGAHGLLEENPRLYHTLLQAPCDPKHIDEIKKDLHRQFPNHEMFVDNAPGQCELFNVLTAYSILNPGVGYCQAEAPIVAFLVMQMPAVQAFWVFVAICDRYIPNYFGHSLGDTLQRDGCILFALLKRVSPIAYKHLKKQKIDPTLYCMEWFLCIFVRTLPWQTLLRVWDIFFCEGIKIIFKVGLVLLKSCLGRTALTKLCPTMYETLQVLRNPPRHVVEEEHLISQVLKLDLSDQDLELEHKRQTVRRKKELSTHSNS